VTGVGDDEADAHAFRLGQESRTMTRVGLIVGAILAVVGTVYSWRTGIFERVFPLRLRPWPRRSASTATMFNFR
jgi:hypothetical protein